jgi:NADPH-dependent 2,4-dienoyl-CoA reductase/sulfur reductase-like enzyme
MDGKTEAIIIGGGPAGVVSASTFHRYYPEKRVILVKDMEEGVIPCGIPYMFSSLADPDTNRMSTTALEEGGVEVVVDKAVKIDRPAKMVETAGGDRYFYEKLILATGSSPIVPPIPGIDRKGIYPVHKDMKYLRKMIEEIRAGKDILILGGGFIGVEFADEISKTGKANVYLAEVLPHLLANSFDREFSLMAEEKLKTRGVQVLTDSRVVEFLGGEKVEAVKLENGRQIKVDGVILGIGAVPNVTLAKNAGLDIGKGPGIWVDEYMRTSDPDIFAVGDCAGKRDFYTRRNAPVMLASTATAEARIAGSNLYKLKVVRENKGTIAVYSTYIDGLVLGSAGLTEISARNEGFEIAMGTAEFVDKHPVSLPGANKGKVKLIFSQHSGILMGGQVSGGPSAGEIINIIGLAIEQRVSVTELETLQVATHPCLTSAPTMYPIVLAAQNVSAKM